MLCTVVFGGIASVFIVEGGPLGTGDRVAHAGARHRVPRGVERRALGAHGHPGLAAVLLLLLLRPQPGDAEVAVGEPGRRHRHDHLPGRLAGAVLLRGEAGERLLRQDLRRAGRGGPAHALALSERASRSCSAARSTPRPSGRPPCRPATPGRRKVPGRWSRARRPRAPTAPRANAGPVPRANAGPVPARRVPGPGAPRRACVTPCPSPSARGRRAWAGWRPPARR